MNIAYNMDCVEYMRTLPDKAFDLAIVDPPYGIREDGGRNRCHYVKQKNGASIYVEDGGYEKSPGINIRLILSFFVSFSVSARTKSSGAQTTLSCPLLAPYFGTK